MNNTKKVVWLYLISMLFALSLNLLVIPNLPLFRDSLITMAVVSIVTTALINIVVISVFIIFDP